MVPVTLSSAIAGAIPTKQTARAKQIALTSFTLLRILLPPNFLFISVGFYPCASSSSRKGLPWVRRYGDGLPAPQKGGALSGSGPGLGDPEKENEHG
jgi:hypothetical protein